MDSRSPRMASMDGSPSETTITGAPWITGRNERHRQFA